MPGPEAGDPSDRLERAILGDAPIFTAEQVAAEAGVSIDEARRLWRALGFPEPGVETAFSAADASAVSRLTALVDSGLIDFDTAVNLTRALGQTDGPPRRLGGGHAGAPRRAARAGRAGHRAAATLSALRMVEELNVSFEQMMLYAWRRHLAAAVARIEALGANEADLHTTQLTVGFADIVSFTALSNEIGEHRVGDLVEVFESRCADVVAAQPRAGDQEPRRLGALRERRPGAGASTPPTGSSRSSAATPGCPTCGSGWPAGSW